MIEKVYIADSGSMLGRYIYNILVNNNIKVLLSDIDTNEDWLFF